MTVKVGSKRIEFEKGKGGDRCWLVGEAAERDRSVDQGRESGRTR